MSTSVVFEDDVYATVQDVRGRLNDDEGYGDGEIIAAIAYATELVNKRAGKRFGTIVSQTAYDVRSDTAVFNTSGTVTSVHVGEVELPITSYKVLPYGIRFYAPYDGVFYHPSRPLTVEPIRTWWMNGRGVDITVTGSFGEPVGPLVKKATLLLAVAELREMNGVSDTSAVLGDLPDNVVSLSVEGLSVSLQPGSIDSGGSISTGNITADRLIDTASDKQAFAV